MVLFSGGPTGNPLVYVDKFGCAFQWEMGKLLGFVEEGKISLHIGIFQLQRNSHETPFLPVYMFINISFSAC